MANQFPEVLPEVRSMPTTGWFCQTGGSARRRVTSNSSPTEDQGVYNVKGVPGHTHNASAVVSVDADYSSTGRPRRRPRQSAFLQRCKTATPPRRPRDASATVAKRDRCRREA